MLSGENEGTGALHAKLSPGHRPFAFIVEQVGLPRVPLPAYRNTTMLPHLRPVCASRDRLLCIYYWMKQQVRHNISGNQSTSNDNLEPKYLSIERQRARAEHCCMPSAALATSHRLLRAGLHRTCFLDTEERWGSRAPGSSTVLIFAILKRSRETCTPGHGTRSIQTPARQSPRSSAA